MTAPRPRTRQPRQLDAGRLQAEISSFTLHLAAGNKAAKTIRTYTEAVQWFAAAHLLQQDSRDTWEQVDGHDIQQWMSRLLDRYSSAYASNQYRARQQFFKWLAAEDQLPDPMAGLLQPPPVPQQLIPVFTGQELARLEQACADRTFAQRRDTAIIAVFTAKASGCPSWPASASEPPRRPSGTGSLAAPQTCECPGPLGYRGTLTPSQDSGPSSIGSRLPSRNDCGYAYGDQRCHRSKRWRTTCGLCGLCG